VPATKEKPPSAEEGSVQESEMPGPPAKVVQLSERQRRLLEEMARRPKSSQRLARRAKILLEAARGTSNEGMRRRLGLNQVTIRRWRGRASEALRRLSDLEDALQLEGASAGKVETLLRKGLEEALDDAPRPGTPVRFSAEQVCEIVALACEEPDKYGRPVTHWTPRELAEEAVKQHIVPQISRRSVGRFLKGERAQAPSKPLLAQPGD